MWSTTRRSMLGLAHSNCFSSILSSRGLISPAAFPVAAGSGSGSGPRACPFQQQQQQRFFANPPKATRRKWTFKQKSKRSDAEGLGGEGRGPHRRPMPKAPPSARNSNLMSPSSAPKAPGEALPKVPDLAALTGGKLTGSPMDRLRLKVLAQQKAAEAKQAPPEGSRAAARIFRGPDGLDAQERQEQAWRELERKLVSNRVIGAKTPALDVKAAFEGEGIVTRTTPIVQPEDREGREPDKLAMVHRRMRVARKIGVAVEMILSQKIWEMDVKRPDRQNPFVVNLRAHGFQVNSIRLSRDQRHVTLRWSINDQLDPSTITRLLHHTPESVLPEALQFQSIVQGMLDKYSKEIQYVIGRDLNLRVAPQINFIHDWKAERDDIKQRELQSAVRSFRKQRRAMRLALLQRKGVVIPEEFLPHMRLTDQIAGRTELASLHLGEGRSSAGATTAAMIPDHVLDQYERLEKLSPEEREEELVQMHKRAFAK